MLAVRDLAKDFAAVRALDGVTLDFRAGEVHGLVGENGAGKSTLMNILAGVLAPSRGELLLDGVPVHFRSPSDALRAGVAMVHQELNLVDTLSVAENIVLGRERTRWRLIRRGETLREARRQLERVGCRARPRTPVAALGIAERQLVEIAKALSCDARVLILDEPTAVLGRPEVERLFGVVRDLRKQGRLVILISHMLPEVLGLCDRISVLRDGRLVATLDEQDVRRASEQQLASLMVGRPMGDHFPPRAEPAEEVRLEVRGLRPRGAPAAADFELRRGEILGFAGLIGAGRTEIGEAIAGLRRRDAGEIAVDGAPVRIATPQDAVRAGIAYLSEDRRGRGLVMGLSVTRNLTLVALRRYARPLISARAERRAAASWRERLCIRAPRLGARIETLSGGNQQKVALAKWLETELQVLILDEPTRGVDIGAKEEIYRHVAELAARGMACVLISSEINELLGLCHRIAVVRGGGIVAMLDARAASEEQIVALASGVAAA